jgi:hypothetical protein
MTNTFINTDLRPSIYFFHIPKTGGMSLRLLLADQYRDAERCPAHDWPDLAGIPQHAIESYRLFFGHFTANLKEYLPPSIRTMTFLRDPVERTISAIRHMIRDPHFHPFHDRVRGRALKEVIYDDQVMLLFQDAQAKLLCFDVPISDVLAYVARHCAAARPIDIGELGWEWNLDKAMRRLDSFDFVGHMNRFEESTLALCDLFNFVPPLVMPDINKAAVDDKSSSRLEDADIEHVKSFLDADIRLFKMVSNRKLPHPNRESLLDRLVSGGVLSPISLPFELNLGRPFAGSGWYEPELQQNGTNLRWSGLDSVATIYLPISREEPRAVTLKVLKPAHISDISIYADSQRVETLPSIDGSVCTFGFDLPPSAPNITTIMVDSGRVSTRKERQDSDLRSLGLVLISLTIV